MHITRTDLSPTQIKLTITATPEELTPIKDSVVSRLGKNVKVQGFRAGKAPQHLIEKGIDFDLLQGDFLDEAMTQLYARATREEDIRPVTRPEVDVKKFVPFTALEFDVTTNIIGKVTLPDYTKLSVAKKTVAVTAKDVDGVVASLRTRLAEKADVERAAKKGDEAVIDFKGTDSDGKSIAGADGEDYPLPLGSDTFIPGFEENVIGMQPGEEKTFTLTFPKDYGVAALANKDVTFAVTLKKVVELTEPKADDEFAAKVGPFKTLTELKEDIKKQLTIERERDGENEYQNELVKAVAQKSKVEIPEALINQQVTYNVDEVKRNLMNRGQTFAEFLASEKKTEEEYKEELKPQAIEQLTASLVLAEIAQKENLTVEQEELEIRLQQLKGQYSDPAMQAELDKPENQKDIASRMLSEKVIEVLSKNAV